MHISYKLENVIVAVFIAVGAFLAFVSWYSSAVLSTLVVYDICGDGSASLVDGVLTTEDHFTIRNTSPIKIDLDDVYFSDDRDEPKKLTLQGGSIAPGEKKVITLDDSSPFRIHNGETIYVSDATGTVRGEYLYDTERNSIPGPPVLSAESGYYADDFDLEMFLPVGAKKDVRIYYTLDGSRPTSDSDEYLAPIKVTDRSGDEKKAFIVRAVAIDSKENRSDTADAVYFIGEGNRPEGKVISLMADPDALFGVNGICENGLLYDEWESDGAPGDAPTPNYMQTGKAWEIAGSMQFLDDGVHKGSQDIGIRVFGGTTRMNPRKYFSLYSRKKYNGSDRFGIDLFGNGNLPHSLSLKGVGDTGAILEEVSATYNVASQDYAPVTVFLNGDFWYDTYVCEKYSAAFLRDHYGIDEDNVIIVKEGGINEGRQKDRAYYDEIYEYLDGHDLSDLAAYEGFCKIIDVDSYIRYCCANLYCCNLDQDEYKNCMLYRARTPQSDGEGDGRWRWMLYDMDALEWVSDDPGYYGAEDPVTINTFSIQPENVPTSFENRTMFKALRQNDAFCQQFVDTFLDMMESNYGAEHVSAVLSKYGEDMTYMNSFFEKRGDIMKQYLFWEFGVEQ